MLFNFRLCIQNRAHEWLFSSEEGQWMVVESSKAARLVMVTLLLVREHSLKMKSYRLKIFLYLY